MLNDWSEISEGYHSSADGTWTLYLRLDESGALLEVYDGTVLVTTSKWGPAVVSRNDGVYWCKKQSSKILEQEQKKRK